MNIKINKKDDIILKILHYFVTEEDYKPVIINGLNNEIWLENMEKDLQLIRININYIHNNEQLNNDIYKAKSIRKSIMKNTFSFKMNMLNLLLDTSEYVDFNGTARVKNIATIKIDNISDFKKNNFICEFFPGVSEAILNDKMDPVQFLKLTDDMNQKTIKNEKKLAKIFSQKKPVITYLLIVINVVMFLLTMALSDRLDVSLNYYLANNYLFIQAGQFYRLFTSMFMHADIIHLLFNMYALYVIGPQIERYYGKVKFLLIYIISGLLGSVFSSVFMSANTLSLGASGAIFGLFGSLAYFTYYYRATLQGLLRSQIFPVIVINLIMGFMINGIDVWGHVGGLIGGILVSMFIGIGDKGRKNDRVSGLITLILMFAFLIYMLFTK